jgi:hypothetical protein
MSDYSRSGRQSVGKAPGQQSQDPAYLPSDKSGYARVRAEREEAASQINRTVKAWRKEKGGEAGNVDIPEGGGQPLSPAIRKRMEPKLGTDLSGARVHTGDKSAKAAQGLSARAFTVGSDVHFNAGEYAPGTKEGDRLLAHELTHVAQGQKSGIHRKPEAGEKKVSSPDEPAEQEADKFADKVADSAEESAQADEKEGGHDEEKKDAKGKGKDKAKKSTAAKGAALDDVKADAEEGKEESADGEKKAADDKAEEKPAEAPAEVATKIHRAPAADAKAKDPKQAELDKKKDLLKKRVELAAKDAEVVQNAVKIVTSAVTDAVSLITGPLAGLAAQGVIKNIMNILSSGANLAITVQRDMQAAVMNKAIESMTPEQIDAKIAAWSKDEPTFSDMKGQIDTLIAEGNEECSLVDQDIESEKLKGAAMGAKAGTKNKVLNAGGKAATVVSTGKAIVSVAKAAAGVAAKEQVKTGVLGFFKKVMDAVPVLGTAISIGVCVKSCIDASKLRSEVEALEKDLGLKK